MRAVLKHIALPDFGRPAVQPVIPVELHSARRSAFIDRFRAAGFEQVLVYADREHCANMSYLTGFDPRFEEALLILAPQRAPVILTGLENFASAKAACPAAEVVLYPPFGLMGQDRSRTRPLDEILRAYGLVAGSNTGMAGWKYFGQLEGAQPDSMLDAPSYLVDAVRRITGDRGRVRNAAALLMHPSHGLRAVNEIDQLAAFEFAACHTSDAVRRVVVNARPGMTEFEAIGHLQQMGLPLSCHAMVSSGARAALGLGSPSSKRIAAGEPVTVGYGVWGALNCRAGFMVHDASELAPGIGDYVERLVAPYFAAVAQWYETIGLGVTGGELFAGVHKHLGDPFFGVALNPGHLIHIDEWMNSPIYEASVEQLVSGQALQLDIIPATGSPYFTTNVEDGLCLLDARGRAELAERYPGCAERIAHRRDFMASALGVTLKPEVLPLSNMPAYLTPFFLSPDMAMTIQK